MTRLSGLRITVLTRDGQCIAALLDASHECRDRWGERHDPRALAHLELGHVRHRQRWRWRLDSRDARAAMSIVMDYPAAWEFVDTTDPKDHDERCSWRQTGFMLCDCRVLWDEYERREDALDPDEEQP